MGDGDFELLCALLMASVLAVVFIVEVIGNGI